MQVQGNVGAFLRSVTHLVRLAGSAGYLVLSKSPFNLGKLFWLFCYSIIATKGALPHK